MLSGFLPADSRNSAVLRVGDCAPQANQVVADSGHRTGAGQRLDDFERGLNHLFACSAVRILARHEKSAPQNHRI